MPVFVGDDIIKDDHSVQERHNALNSQALAAVYEVSVNGNTVAFLFGLQESPCRNKLRTVTHKILTHRVRRTLIPDHFIRNMRDSKALHNLRCNHLIKRLLTERIAAALDQAALSVDDFPPLFQIAIRSAVRCTEIQNAILFLFPEQNIANVIGKIVVKEVDIFPLQV